MLLLLIISLQYLTFILGTDELWRAYKEHHGKAYRGSAEEQRRRGVWELNRERVLSHNDLADRGEHTYNLSLNHLADMPARDYLVTKVGLTGSKLRRNEQTSGLKFKDMTIPEEFDWRERGFETTPMDQKECGSCYAFSLAAALQAQLFKKNGTLDELSEQQLVDCSLLFGNFGCRGGSLKNTLRYIKSFGLLTNEEYPYTGKLSICRTLLMLKHKPVSISSWEILPSEDESALKIAVATIGPVAVSINASPYTFQLYHSGIYDDPVCDGDRLNHAMLIVGYTADAWILKNWWTHRWGQDGYMYLRKGVNRCGVANYAAYLTVT